MKKFSSEYSSKISIILILTFCLNLSLIKSQNQQKDTSFLSKNTIFADFSTKGVFYNINFDRIFYQNNKIALTYRFGFSISRNEIDIPLGVNLFLGKKNSHLEFSFVAIPLQIDYKSFLKDHDITDEKMYLVPGIGYRYQRPGGGFFCRAIVSPTILLDPPSKNFWKMDTDYFISTNVGIGYSF